MFGPESLRAEEGHKVRCVEGNWTVLAKVNVATPIGSSAVAQIDCQMRRGSVRQLYIHRRTTARSEPVTNLGLRR